ncbi:MAG: SURF1 family protein [Pseudomonadota bacterium]
MPAAHADRPAVSKRSLAFVAIAVLTVAAFVILLSLGTWQLNRLKWKEGLIAAAQERPLMEPVAAPGQSSWPSFEIDDWNYRRVSLEGRFGEEEVHAWIVLNDANGPHAGAGYFVVAPFTTDDGWTVLVNRGFVPEEQKGQESRPQSAPPAGDVTIEGLIRRDDPPSLFTPSPNGRTRTWFTRHISTIANHFGLQRALVAPYTIDLVAEETPSGGLPQAGESRVTFRNSHLQYALTWYGLAASLVGVVAVGVWSRRQRRSAEPPT